MVTILDRINPTAAVVDEKRVRHPEKAHKPDTPVLRIESPTGDHDPFWLITGYDEAMKVSKEPLVKMTSSLTRTS